VVGRVVLHFRYSDAIKHFELTKTSMETLTMRYYCKLLFLTVIILNLSRNVNGHARLLEPPGRSSMWRFGFGTPVNYNDNQLFCGGYRVSFV